MRWILEAICYVVDGGIPWRLLPKEYPCWQTVYHYFRRFSHDGTWQRIHEIIRQRLRQKLGRKEHPSAGSIDAQSVKTASSRGSRGHDAGKKVNGRKRHILVDTLGLLVLVIVTEASVSDMRGATMLCEQLRSSAHPSFTSLAVVWADASYDKPTLKQWLQGVAAFSLQIIKKLAEQTGFVVLPRRWVVERTFAWLTQSRRLRVDYEVLPESSESMIYLSMTQLMLRRLEKISAS